VSIEVSSLATTKGGASHGAQQIRALEAPGAAPVVSSADAQRFAQALSSYKSQQAQAAVGSSASTSGTQTSIGARLVNGLSDMAGRLKADHKVISSLIEKATVGGDDALMMKAMMALGDYQQRVQIVSKTVSKAASSLDQLTRLQ
jgi:hypothetical protein